MLVDIFFFLIFSVVSHKMMVYYDGIQTNNLKARSDSALRLNTPKPRRKVVSREADDVVRVDNEFKTSFRRFIDVAGRGEKLERRRTRQNVLNCSKL